MNYTAVVIFILLGILVVIVRHFVWRGIVNITRKTLITTIGPKYENGKKKKLMYADIKYKNQQLIISIVGFLVFSFVLIVVFIWLPDMWIGYQIILSLAIVLVPGAIIGILISRRKD
jgi:VIT1/CCC1 family predicted Fe2+/Mn2+ transporter